MESILLFLYIAIVCETELEALDSKQELRFSSWKLVNEKFVIH